MLSGRTDVLVLGAGPAGSALAIRLARMGVSVVLVDRERFPRPKPCAEYLSPETLRHLDMLGVLGRAETEGGFGLAGTRVIGPRGSELTGRFDAAGGAPFRPTGLSIPRTVLDHTLVEAAREAGAQVHEGLTARALLGDRRTDGAVLVDRDGREHSVRAAVTIGADGVRSIVARRIGGVRQGPLRRFALVGHLSGVEGLGDLAEMHVGPAGYVGVNPMKGGVANVALVLPRERLHAAAGRIKDFFFEALDTFASLRGRIPRDGLQGRLEVTGPFDVRARRVIADGALLVGDAAGFFDPFTGEGICTAFHSAELAAGVLARALAGPGKPDAGSLREYAAARRDAFRGKEAVERLIGWGMLAPALFDRAVERLERRNRAHTLIGVTGRFLPARRVLNPAYLAGMVW